MEQCAVCDAPNAVFADGTILGRHRTTYYRCSNCGFIQTGPPTWLPEAYSDAITSSDIGMLGRNNRQARLVTALIWGFFQPEGRFLDYGGGYGILVRLMRDKGFDFHRYDRYCSNLFAQGFDVSGPEQGPFELVTAFELLEHVHDPLSEIENLLRYSDSIFFTTELLSEPPPRPDGWWYYGQEHGQHLSFYTLHSLSLLAERFGLHLYSARGTYHLLTKREISPFLFRSVFRKKVCAAIDMICKRKSLRPGDFRRLTGMDIGRGGTTS
jgi:hypothetical protein